MSSEEGKLFVGGLNFNTDEQTLEDHFSSFRPLSESSSIPGCRQGLGDSVIPGFWLISFTNPEHASDAIRTMNGESLDGHQIRADHAGKSAHGTRRGPFGARGHGCSYSRSGGDQGYGNGWYDSQLGGYGDRYGYGYGKFRDYSDNQGGYDRYLGGNYRDINDN